ncbi:hypothetical protein [Paenibacillus sp. yr247]|uniref:hypothetical protein n=1 Tax=Paenibacillus sp. yr247 TaxID=1761880 RepID=UPI000B81D2B0|nr:hypothetical protein [Paenibacillus sp. yr247]
MVVLFIILLSGFGLYALLAPSRNINEESALEELFTEVKLSSIPLPEYSNAGQTHATISAKKE